MSDSEHSTVTYTSASEDDLDMGSPGVEVPIFEVPQKINQITKFFADYKPGPEGPPSPDYVPGPEEPEQAPPSPIYIPLFGAFTGVLTGYIPEFDSEEDLEEDDEEDPEEDPADYPADRGDDDDDDDTEEEHLAPADPAAISYSADQDPYIAYRVTARMSIRPQSLTTSSPRKLLREC
ncbi:hypothetical protein Tco_0367516 [Tanacetum coccineum]